MEIKIISAKFFVFLFFVLMFGCGSEFVTNVDPRTNLLGFVVYVVCFIYLWKNRRKDDNFLGVIIGIVLIGLGWALIQHYIHDETFIIPTCLVILDFILGYLIVVNYGKNIVYYYEKIVYILSFFSIVMWLLVMIFGVHTFYNLPFLMDTPMFADHKSMLIYTFALNVDDRYGYLVRNCGFAWEPGMYSVIICIAICFNVLINNGKIKIKDNHMMVFIISLISTFSTTGYIAICVFVIFYFWGNEGINRTVKYFLLIVFVILCSFIYNLPFISQKLSERSNTQNFVVENQGYVWAEKEDYTICVDRFEGVILDWADIIYEPLWGYGVNIGDSYVHRYISKNLSTSNSLTKPFACYGFFIAFPLLILLWRSTKQICDDFSVRPNGLLFVVIIVGSFSYAWFPFILFHSLQFYSLNNIRKYAE